MSLAQDQISRFLASVHPYDTLAPDVLADLATMFERRSYAADDVIYDLGQTLPALYLIHTGQVEITDEYGAPVSSLGTRNSFGERGLLRDGKALTRAQATTATEMLELPVAAFHALIGNHAQARKFFDRSRGGRPRNNDLASSRAETLMAANPVICAPDDTAQAAAKRMSDRHISALCVVQGGALTGVVTVRDMTGKIVGAGMSPETPVAQIMTPNPITLPPSAIGSDVLQVMMERRIGHVPIVEGGKLVGIITQTDLTRFQAVSSAELVAEIADATTAKEMAKVTARIPRLLVQLVAGGSRHETVTRLITDVADTATRRLLALAEAKLGPPPVPYLWLACGSQGRQEQTGVSDQDNCMILHDDVQAGDMAYFADLANYVCDGLDACGYVYCPGDMMATNPKWCQPLRVWRDYFRGWINKPNPEAQMLASVMFDLRPIGGDETLFAGLQDETLQAASANSIFVAHMISNSLKHTAPLGLLRGLATIRSGEHKNHIDMKHNGVVPIADLARVYALRGQLGVVNTRARLEAAQAAGVLSESGARDLLDAYDLIAETRLNHQAAQIRQGDAPDNFLAPGGLSDFERSHLRDAFVVVKTMQSAVGHGRGALS